MRGMLSPSLMCADPLNVQQELTVLDDLGVDYIHLDFMDNHFVPNLTLSPELIKATKKVLRHMKRDIHIMAVEPQQYFDRMDIGEGDIVAVHYEACPDLGAVLADIRQRGATPAIALQHGKACGGAQADRRKRLSSAAGGGRSRQLGAVPRDARLRRRYVCSRLLLTLSGGTGHRRGGRQNE